MKGCMGLKSALCAVLAIVAAEVASPAEAQSAPFVSLTGTSAKNTPAAQPGATDFDYILGPSDVLHIEALNHPDFNVKTTIGSDNNIQLPYIGSFPASNLTISALRDRILAELKRKGVFSDITLQVDVVQYSSRFVTVLGGVTSPGLIPVDRAYHLSEILARVGGVKDGSSQYVILTTKNRQERRITVEDLATGTGTEDPLVSPGDKIYVPAEVFYVQGQVKAPGAYPLTLNMTLAMALARGGGITEAGSTHSIKITRDNTQVDAKDLNFKIKPNDVIDVGTSWF